jgi:hypothetical protein
MSQLSAKTEAVDPSSVYEGMLTFPTNIEDQSLVSDHSPTFRLNISVNTHLLFRTETGSLCPFLRCHAGRVVLRKCRGVTFNSVELMKKMIYIIVSFLQMDNSSA